MRHKKRLTRDKVPVKHASTLLDNSGPGVGSYFAHVIYETTAGARALGGGTDTLRTSETTGRMVMVGDVIRYISACVQTSPRGADSTNIKDDAGWIEWALVWQREKDAAPNVTNIGTETLGVICSRAFRENCFYTGCFPYGSRQSNSIDIKHKLPEKCCRLKLGDILKLFCYVRGSSSTDTRTDSNRLIVSSHFKTYS